MSYPKTKALYEASVLHRLTFNTLEILFSEIEDEYYTEDQQYEDADDMQAKRI